MQKRQTIICFLFRAAQWIFGLGAAIILWLVLFRSSVVSYGCKVHFPYSNIFYLALGLALFFIVRLLEEYMPEKIRAFFRSRSNAILAFSTLLLTFLMIYCVYNYYFLTDWDPQMLLHTAQDIVSGAEWALEYVKGYFSNCSNNLFLVFIFTVFMRLEKLFGILDIENSVMAILSFQCLLSALTGVLIFKIMHMWKHSLRLSWNAYALYVLSISISPWVSIPYSDSIGLIFPVCVLYLLLKKTPHTLCKAFLICAISLIGACIKPQLIIVFIAMALYYLLHLLYKKTLSIKRLVSHLAACLLGFITASFLLSASINTLGIEIDPNDSLDPSHYLMMGLNREFNGMWNAEDRAFTQNTPPEIRTQENLRVIRERVASMSLSDWADHLEKKSLSIFSNGTWGWGFGGVFFHKMLDNKNAGMSPFLKSIYYPNGKRYPLFLNHSQMMWMLLLSGSFLSFFYRGKTPDRVQWILMVSLIGLSLFNLLFEARSRYLYCYVPFFILLACSSLESLFQSLRHRFRSLLLKRRSC